MKANSAHEALIETITATLDDKKAENIVVLTLQKGSSIADAFVIATGLVDRHCSMLADEVEERVSQKLQEKPLHTEGYQEKEWIVLDYSTVIVHIMLPAKRSALKLEELWSRESRQEEIAETL